MTGASILLNPVVLHQDDGALVWATPTRAGSALVFDLHALVTSPAGRHLLEPVGPTLFDEGRPRLSWALVLGEDEQALPVDGSGGGSGQHGIWSWTAQCSADADAVRVRVSVPALAVELDETVAL